MRRPKKTLGYVSTIDRHEKSGGSSNLHFDEMRLARLPLFCLSTSSLVPDTKFVKHYSASNKLLQLMEAKDQETITLKNLRESANLTQPELSRRMGVGIRIIGDWERGESIPRFDRAIALARELGVPLKTLARCMGLDVAKIPDDLPT